MFSDKQTTALGAKLDAGAIKTRSKGGKTLSYLEGYAAIDNANRIFGFGNWQGGIVDLTQVEAGEYIGKDSAGKDKKGWRASYIVKYGVVVYNEDHSLYVSFNDVGYGDGTSYNSLGDAVESATKEAVTDAMKRTLRNFGNQFGLALYDKEQRGVANGFDVEVARALALALPQATIEDARDAIKLTTREELGALYNEIKNRKVENKQAA